MKDTIISLIEDLRPDVDAATETALVTGNVPESFDIVSLVNALQDEFEIEITPKELVPENFDSVDALVDMVERLLEE